MRLGRFPASLGLLLALLWTACGVPPGNRRDTASSGASSDDGTTGSRVVPDFALEDVHGKLVRLSDTAGKVRLIDFWATWCPPCREAIPGFKELYRTYGDKGFMILAISMDGEEAKKILPPFVERYKIPYTNIIGNDDVAQAFGGVVGLPTTFLVDREGRIVETFVGGVPKEVFEKKIRELL